MSEAGKYQIVKTLFPDEEWEAMHALAAERGVAPDRILADAVGAWIEAGMPKVDIPRNVVPIYEGKREELAYYLALRWWLRQKRGAY